MQLGSYLNEKITQWYWLLSGSCLCLLALACGCATPTNPAVLIQPACDYPLHQEKQDLHIAVQPFKNKAQLQRYFQTNLLAKGILALLVIAENHHPNASFLLLKNEFLLGSVNAGNYASRPGDSVRGRFPETVATMLGTGLATNLLALQASTSASRVKHNLVAKELRPRTLAPGSSQSGFVYFKLPGKSLSTEKFVVTIRVIHLGNNEKIDFVFTL